MKKVLALFIVISALSSSLFAYEYKVGDVQKYFNEKINMTVMPYNGAFGVNLRDSGSYPVRNGNVEYRDGSIIKNDASHYFDDQMVANGIIEGIFKNSPDSFDQHNGTWEYNYRYRYRLLKVSSMTLRVDCSSDFMFVSQSDDSYKRPFYLYVLPRAVSGENKYAGDPTGTIAPILVTDSSPVEIPAPSNFDDYTSIWFDLILALPGEVTDEGVTVGNTFYPLSDADDYTAEVTITIEWTGDYEIDRERRFGYGLWEGYDKYAGPETVTIERTMTIPFSGYCSFDEPESTGSLYISTTSESQEINLDPDTASSVKVADISYLVNFGHGLSGSQPAYDDSKAWMFLSASPDPGSSSQDGFRLVNQNATGSLTDYNSVPFLVTVEGNGQFIEFDGRAKASDFTPDGGIDTEYIETACIWEQHRFNSPNSGTQYYHSHNFEGEVFVEVTPKSDLIAPGRYVGDIYVHVITNGD